MTAPGDKARSVWYYMVGQVRPRLGLTLTHPLDEESDGRLEVTLADRLDDNVRSAHSSRLAYARRRTLMHADERVINCPDAQPGRRVLEKAGLNFVRVFHQPWPYRVDGRELGDVEYAVRKNEWEQHNGITAANRSLQFSTW